MSTARSSVASARLRAIDEQANVVALPRGIATTDDGRTQLHAHAVVAKRGGAAFGGHLMEMRSQTV